MLEDRRHIIGNDDPIRVRRALAALPIEVEAVTSDHVLSAVSDLGRRLDITSYDSAYVELAARGHGIGTRLLRTAHRCLYARDETS